MRLIDRMTDDLAFCDVTLKIFLMVDGMQDVFNRLII